MQIIMRFPLTRVLEWVYNMSRSRCNMFEIYHNKIGELAIGNPAFGILPLIVVSSPLLLGGNIG